MSTKRTLSKSGSILSDIDLEEGDYCLRPSSYLKIGDKVSLFGESDTGVRGFVSTLGYVIINGSLYTSVYCIVTVFHMVHMWSIEKLLMPHQICLHWNCMYAVFAYIIIKLIS